MEDAVSETNPTPHLPCPALCQCYGRHGGTDGSDRLIDGARRSRPAGPAFQGIGIAIRAGAAQPRSPRPTVHRVLAMPPPKTTSRGSTDWAKILDSVADGAHYHVQHIDGLGLPLFRATNQVGHRRSALGHRRPTDAPEQTVSKHPYCPQGHLRR